MDTSEWLRELCPEIAEWQIEIIAEHFEGIARTAYNEGFEQGMETARKLDDVQHDT